MTNRRDLDPEPERAPDRSPIRWGIMATGSIASKFADDLQLVADHRLTAVASRTLERAEAFARRYGSGVRAYGTYQALVDDPDVDVVYVATPHGRHTEDVMSCFDSGKAVLCEKALTIQAGDARQLVAEARKRELFFAEAMWMRLNPSIRHVTSLVADGACGRIGQLRAELGFRGPDDKARLWDRALGASALLDVGVYPLTLAHMILGPPTGISATGQNYHDPHTGPFDVSGGATLVYDSGAIASLAWTQVAASDNRASIAGDRGRIEFGPRMHEPAEFTLTTGSESHTWRHNLIGRGYAYEAIEVGDCLRAGRTESEHLPLDTTIEILEQMEHIRAQLAAGPTWVQ